MAAPEASPDAPSPSGPARWARQALSWLGSLVAVLVLVMGVGWLRAPALPDEAPPFTLRDLEGELVSLEDFRGQTVILNFWATWCGPCRIEIPSFSAFADAHPDIPVLGIAADGPAAKLRRESEKLGITYTVLQGDRQTLQAYGIGTYPTTVVVGPDGTVKHAHVGILLRPQLAWITGRAW